MYGPINLKMSKNYHLTKFPRKQKLLYNTYCLYQNTPNSIEEQLEKQISHDKIILPTSFCGFHSAKSN